jgi:hypothetical protein
MSCSNKHVWIAFFLSLSAIHLFGQKIQSSKAFFADTSVLRATVTTDVKNLQRNKAKPVFQPATFTWHNADSSRDVTETVKIKQRGNARKDQCNLAGLMVDFSIKGVESRFQNLGEIKWVAPCNFNKESEQWILKEYLVYKLYNVITDQSFRVRLMQLTLNDEKNKAKPVTNYAFAIEPTDDVAKRLKFSEVKEEKVLTEQTNRAQTTLVTLFQYMIGNTDWAVPIKHNVKLFRPVDSAITNPYVIPYDFDYSGIVFTSYAIPYEGLPISSVLDRYYLGFPRTIEEIMLVLDVLSEKREALKKTIQDFAYLNKTHKAQMIDYLEGFYALVQTEKQIKFQFIDNARKR